MPKIIQSNQTSACKITLDCRFFSLLDNMTVSIIQLKIKKNENVCRPCLSAGYGEL